MDACAAIPSAIETAFFKGASDGRAQARAALDAILFGSWPLALKRAQEAYDRHPEWGAFLRAVETAAPEVV